MKSIKLLFVVVAIAMSLAACGGKPKNKITLEEAKGPGRDKELYRDAVTACKKGNFDQCRILINTMINTYPESSLVKIAKLSNADSFYLQGGSKNLAQAEAAYREFVEFFPDDPLADDVMIKMAEIHLRQVEAPDRDPTHAKLAERQLKETLRRYPNTDRKDQIDALMTDVQEILAMHELQVARFNFKFRQAMAGAQLRSEEILNKYPNFSRFDEALWIHAQAMAAQEDTQSASDDLTRLVTNYPKSDFADKAKEQLAKYGKAVPQADPAKATADDKNDKGMVSKMTGFLFGPKIGTSDKGVIIDRSLKTDEIIAHAQELAGPASAGGPVTPGATTTTNVNDSRPRRATGSASQDVEVKSGSPTQQTPASSSKKDKDKKKKEDDKKKPDNSSILRNP
jgi:outer membrane protein assembly factor BamD